MALMQCIATSDFSGPLDLLRSLDISDLARLAAVLLPAAEAGLAGPHTRVLLTLIGRVLVERERAA